MKRCPQCNQTYNDGTLNFCLLDGTALAVTDSEPTVMLPKQAPVRKRRALIWAAAIILILFTGAVSLSGFLVYRYGGFGETSSKGQWNGVNATPSPRPSATPKVSSTPPASPSPLPEQSTRTGATPKPTDDKTDEVTPIAWSTAAVQFKGETGMTYRFACPEGGTASAIWGSDIYTADSSICTAAVHAGVITREGGEVTIEFRPGRITYGSTERHGITSNTFGEYGRSFVVR